MQIPFVDLGAQNAPLASELGQNLWPVISGGRFVLGPAVEAFEDAFARFVGAEHCVGVNSGTSALHLALAAAEIGPSDEVITTPHSWISTCWAISYVGARPVFADIDPVTYTIDPDAVERAISPRTKAILPVHLYGRMCNMTALREIAQRHGLLLIEDAAQAHGARWEGRSAGGWGTAGCFSFYPGKNLGAFGEAGAVVTNDAQLARRIGRLRDHAQQERHVHTEIGFNARMDALQAAVLEVKLRRLADWNAKRQWAANLYSELLSDLPNIETPQTPPVDSHVWHLYVVLARGISREQLRQQLAERGVHTAVHYPTPIPFQKAYEFLGHQSGDFPVCEDVMNRCLSLPLYAEMTQEQIEYVTQAVRDSVGDSSYPSSSSSSSNSSSTSSSPNSSRTISTRRFHGLVRQTDTSDRRRWLHRIASSRCAG